MKKILAFCCLLCFANLASAQAKYTVENNQLKLPTAIVFETGSDRIKPESLEALQQIKLYLEEKTYISTLRIEAHVDAGGSEAEKQRLTEKRALAVGKWLVNQGIDCRRLLCTGFGSSKPIADNATPEGKAANRRITIVNAGLRGRAIGGMPIDGGGKVAGELCP